MTGCVARWLLCGVFCWATVALAASEGKPAPEFHAELFSHGSFSLKKSPGQVVIVHFWATWCAACRREMQVLDTYYNAHRNEGLRVIAVSMDERKDEAMARALIKAFHFDAALAREASFKDYGRIWRLPLTFLIDRQGILRKDGWVQDGGLTAADLDKTVTPLLKAAKN